CLTGVTPDLHSIRFAPARDRGVHVNGLATGSVCPGVQAADVSFPERAHPASELGGALGCRNLVGADVRSARRRISEGRDGDATNPDKCQQAGQQPGRSYAYSVHLTHISNLLRVPTGLADGLALKEPRPHEAVGSPQTTGSPAPRVRRGD